MMGYQSEEFTWDRKGQSSGPTGRLCEARRWSRLQMQNWYNVDV